MLFLWLLIFQIVVPFVFWIFFLGVNAFNFYDPSSVCPNCLKQFKDPTRKNFHLRYVCLAERAFKCPHCMYSAKRKHDLQSHVETRHLRPKNAERLHQCLNCNRKYFHKNKLVQHLRNTGHLPKVALKYENV